MLARVLQGILPRKILHVRRLMNLLGVNVLSTDTNFSIVESIIDSSITRCDNIIVRAVSQAARLHAKWQCVLQFQPRGGRC